MLHYYFGALAYADDCILLALSVDSLQKMVEICEEHAKNNDLEFSTDPDPLKSKTVCMCFGDKSRETVDVILNNDKLPWKVKTKHIGNTLHENCLMDQDILEKKGIFIDQCMNLNQEFRFASSEVQLKMLHIYNCHFTGSVIWNFNSEELQKFYNSFNMNIKAMFDLPWSTHRWICEKLAGKHMKQMIYKHYINFLNSIQSKCSKNNVKFLMNLSAQDVRSNTGSNIRRILLDTGMKIIPGSSSQFLLNDYSVYEVPKGQEWRYPFLCSLLKIRDNEWEVLFDDESQLFEESDITHMINDIATS